MEEVKQLRRSTRIIKKREDFPVQTTVQIKKRPKHPHSQDHKVPKHPHSQDHKVPKKWSRTEKSQLLAALEIYDETDISSISECIPTKTEPQIESFINNFKKKANSICKKVSKINQLEKWTRLISKGKGTEDFIRYNSLNLPLYFISLFEELPHPHCCDGIDFKAAYEFVFCILAEIPPKPTNKKTMEFIYKTITEMGEMIDKASDLKTYIQEKFYENAAVDSEDFLNPFGFPVIDIPLSENNRK